MIARETIISRGTLDVALATTRSIVVATDSRRANLKTGNYTDNIKKLFVLGKNRILAISGLVDAYMERLPLLTAHIVPLLEIEISRFEHFEQNAWNDPAPPPGIPDKFRKYWNSDPYMWWNVLCGPLQTILNIAACYEQTNLSYFCLEGILAGFKANGEAKIERLILMPQKGVSNWGRPVIGIGRALERTTTTGQLIWKTAGKTKNADLVLEGDIGTARKKFAGQYPAIGTFLKRRGKRAIDEISETEMIALAKDLIRATASRESYVGSEPIQLATLRPGGEVIVDQPSFPSPNLFLPAEGTWHLGVVFTPEYAFDERKQNVVYTSCEIKNNRIPLPLGDNHFYGNVFEDVTFVYTGGPISFDSNTIRGTSRLIIVPGVDESPLARIRHHFTELHRA